MTFSNEIAATERELRVAEALAAEIRRRDLSSFVDYQAVTDANVALAEAMAAEGLDITVDDDDFATANRITGTVDLLLSPSIGRYDENGEPLACQDCSRQMAWDEQRGDYRHLVDPARGCFLIGPEDQTAPATRIRRDRLTQRLDQLSRPPDSTDPPGREPPDTPGMGP